MTTVAAIIIGIDNWDKYTLPLAESIKEHEPSCRVVIVDNASETPYPYHTPHHVVRTARLCYSAAINIGKAYAGDADWYVVLSNDVLCTAPFIDKLSEYGNEVVGPLLKSIDIAPVGRVDYLEGWCVCIPRALWDVLGGWDEGMQVSSYEDVEYSHRARTRGFGLVEDKDLGFTHLDQKQRFYLVPNYWSSEAHNRMRFIEKYARVAA